MAENICWYEERAKHTGIDFISIKRNGQDTLVFNPKMIEAALGDYAYLISNYTDKVTKRTLNGICANCDLCTPKTTEEYIKDSDTHRMLTGFRIERRNYQQFKSEVPLFTASEYSPTEPQNGFKVAFIDDQENSFRGARQISRLGFRVLNIFVDPEVKPSEIACRYLRKAIIDWNPDCVVSDKGLGFVDGIDLVIACKEAGIKTILFTGEIQTAETRKVADRFLTKPMSLCEISEEILYLISPTQ